MSTSRQVVSEAESAEITTAGEWAEGSPAWKNVWKSICGVWASKWNDRAWLSRKARGIKDDDLKMAVLVQQVPYLFEMPKISACHILTRSVGTPEIVRV